MKLNTGKKAKGKNELIRHRNGERLTYKQAVIAKCYECCGDYADGKVNCRITTCPLYQFMPYRDIEKRGHVRSPK